MIPIDPEVADAEVADPEVAEPEVADPIPVGSTFEFEDVCSEVTDA